MELNCQRNLLTYQKSLYSKQVFYYSKLCELYKNLANLNPSVESADKIVEMYSKPLSLATSGDLESIQADNYSKDELDIFKKFEGFSQRFFEYRKLNNSFKNFIESGEAQTIISNGEIVDPDFFKPNNSSKEIDEFNNDISKKTLNAISFQTSTTLRKSSKVISNIDSSAIPQDKRLIQVTPKSCGADISKARSIEKNSKYKTNKSKTRKKFISALIATALIGIGVGKNYLEYSNLSATENEKNGYEVLVSDTTKSELENIGTAINIVKSSDVEPDYESLHDLRTNLDETIDHVMSDLVTKAFNEKNPNYKVVSVETSYDRTLGSKDDPQDQTFCQVTYLDENEEEIITLVNFNSDIRDSFDQEYSLDHSSLSLEDLENIYTDINHLAGTEFEYSSGNPLKYDLKSKKPSRVSEKENENSEVNDDYERY